MTVNQFKKELAIKSFKDLKIEMFKLRGKALRSPDLRQISGPFYFGGTILLPVAIILLLINQKLPSNELSSLAKFTWVYMSVCVLVFWHLQYIFIHNRVIGYVCSLISFVTFLLFSMRLVFSPM